MCVLPPPPCCSLHVKTIRQADITFASFGILRFLSNIFLCLLTSSFFHFSSFTAPRTLSFCLLLNSKNMLLCSFQPTMDCDYTTFFTFWNSFLFRQFILWFTLFVVLPKIFFSVLLGYSSDTSSTPSSFRRFLCFRYVSPDATFFWILIDFFHPRYLCLSILVEGLLSSLFNSCKMSM